MLLRKWERGHLVRIVLNPYVVRMAICGQDVRAPNVENYLPRVAESDIVVDTCKEADCREAARQLKYNVSMKGI